MKIKEIKIMEKFYDKISKKLYKAIKKDAKRVLKEMEDEKLYCEFDKPQRAVTPGQSLVVYQDGYVLCGGEIISE